MKKIMLIIFAVFNIGLPAFLHSMEPEPMQIEGHSEKRKLFPVIFTATEEQADMDAVDNDYHDKYYFITAHDEQTNDEIGFIELGPVKNAPDQWLLSGFEVKTSYQGQGIGTRLFKRAIVIAAKSGAKEVTWNPHALPSSYGQESAYDLSHDELTIIYQKLCEQIQSIVPGRLFIDESRPNSMRYEIYQDNGGHKKARR